MDLVSFDHTAFSSAQTMNFGVWSDAGMVGTYEYTVALLDYYPFNFWFATAALPHAC